MNWTKILSEIDAFLSDDKIRSDVTGFLTAIGYEFEADDETIVFPKDTDSIVEERTLIRNAGVEGGGYFLVKCVLISSPREDGSCYPLGKLKIMYDLNGDYRDDFYSRD